MGSREAVEGSKGGRRGETRWVRICVDTRESEQRGAPTLLLRTGRWRRASRAQTAPRTGLSQPWRLSPVVASSSHHFVRGPTASRPLRFLRGCGRRRSAGTRRPYCEVRRTATPSWDAPKLLRLFLTTPAVTAGECPHTYHASAGPSPDGSVRFQGTSCPREP